MNPQTELIPLRKNQQETDNFLRSPLPDAVTRDIRGNAPKAVKELPVKWLAVFRNRGNAFSHHIAERMKVTDVDIVTSVDDGHKIEGRVVVEVEVTPEMCDGEGVMHQGALVFLIDECSTLSMVVANAAEGRVTPPGVSCSINTLFHSTATAGTKLRIVNRSLAAGYDSNSGRSDVWDSENHKLIASGTQLTMPPSRPTAGKKSKL
ncbi:hypothetical protein CC1G_08179 [Coprinopsis cinerea okayama7|uniref:Thioesterase domain-containing protein n=1 Tax=Coprinopsis cinerea (strain Okayama-7 / 130 / ATCC MYA-4618 / FGSC 9003) TaxID=240176 RepID=A8NZ77_COPC7|nr:hypothetical protein CC1G_08179 [Coprinopsis cinerea okayama7\|eukprot:XP_001837625.1 hypothetical protein CC1G_08179 [Coprinopsis cinerea okayama7\